MNLVAQEMLLSGTEVVGLGRLVLKSSGFYLERDPSVPYLVASRTKEVCHAISIPHIYVLIIVEVLE